jgi:hypothetical protein
MELVVEAGDVEVKVLKAIEVCVLLHDRNRTWRRQTQSAFSRAPLLLWMRQPEELSLPPTVKLRSFIERHNGFRLDLTHFANSGLCAACRRAEPR